MIGGAPMYAPMPGMVYEVPQSMPTMAATLAAPMPAPMPTSAPGTPFNPPRPAQPRPAVVRGVAGTDPPPPRATPPAPLRIPTPEELGVLAKAVPAAPAAVKVPGSYPTTPAVDWLAIHQRLRELHAVGFQMEEVAGGYRFRCWIPQGAGRQQVEGSGSSEAEAVRLCLAQAEKR